MFANHHPRVRVYTNLDTNCLHPTSAVFEAFDIANSENASASASADDKHINQFAVFGRMGMDENFDNSIPNAWMASSPGNPFFFSCL